MRIQQLNPSKQGSHQSVEVQFRQGQILRGRALQIFPLNRAYIQLGSFRFIAQLEASLERGHPYYFQVSDVKEEVHLRVIQHVVESEGNEWNHLLEVIGSKTSNIREQLLQQLVQRNIPFTKSSLQRMFTLLDQYSNQPQAIDALVRMMEQNWPLTKEVLESVIVYQSSTFTKQINHVYESLSQYTTTNHVHHSLLRHLEKLDYSNHQAAKMFQSLFIHYTAKEEKEDVQWLKWMLPQLNKERIVEMGTMTISDIKESIQTFRQFLRFLGVYTMEEQEVFSQMLRAILENVEDFQRDIYRFLNNWERNIQLQAIHSAKEQLSATTYQKLQDSFIKMIPFQHVSEQQQMVIQQHIPRDVHPLLQMMVDLKRMPFDMLESMAQELAQKNTISLPTHHQTDFLRAIRYIIHNIGLSYEHMILAKDTNKLIYSLKGLIMQFIQEQGIGSERVKNLLQYIQGMQLHTVQETTHMLTVQLLIPAMIGRLQSDIHLTFDSKKTPSQTIDPDYCRILFDLELASLKRTIVDMHIQNKQISIVIHTDFSFVKQIAQPFEPQLKENLQKTGYEVTSIRYQVLNTGEHKQFHSSTHMDRGEGVDIKI